MSMRSNLNLFPRTNRTNRYQFKLTIVNVLVDSFEISRHIGMIVFAHQIKVVSKNE